VAADIEYGVIDGKPKVFAVGFCAIPGVSYIFVTGHPDQDFADALVVREYANALLVSPKIRKAFHYGCSDALSLEQYENIHVEGFDWDTIFADYLYNPDAKKYGLDAVAERHFQEFSGYKNIVAKDLMDHLDEGIEVPKAIATARADIQIKWLQKMGQYNLSRCSLETLRLYNGADVHLTKLIELETKRRVPHPLVKLYRDLSFVLKRMEDNGPLFDNWQHKRVARLYPHLEAKLRGELCEMVGSQDFNPGSPQQVFKMVYEHFELEYPMSKGKANTKKQTMMMLSRQHPFPGKVVAWRKVNRAMTTYIAGQKKCAKKFDGRLKSRWNATGTRTGRLSSSGGGDGGVNLQNLHGDEQLQNMCVADRRWRKVFNVIAKYARRYGVTTEEGPHKLKDGTFVPASAKFAKVGRMVWRWIVRHMPDLYTFLILDYGQVEVRVAAQMSGDKNLLRDCLESDIHTVVGVAMTGWKAEDIANDKKTRTLTKNVHFGILFGITKKNLFEFIKAMDPTFEGTPEMVEAAYDRYFQRYPGVQKFIDKQRAFAEANGYVKTMFGLRQPLIIKGFQSKSEDDIDFDSEEFIADVKDDRNASWRNQAVNGPVQGTAHQLMECALVNLHRKPAKYDVLGVPTMEVHDALYMRVKVLELRRAYKKARYLLEQESLNTVKSDFPEIDWKVPIVTDAEAGLRLGGKVPLQYEQGVTTGQFMLQWFFKTREQVRALKAQLAAVESIAA
jgi:DNA polymerase-1